MNKQNVTSNAAVNVSKSMTSNTLQELWKIKDETAENFSSVSAYFEHLRVAQKLLPKSAKRASSSARNAQVKLKTRRTFEMH